MENPPQSVAENVVQSVAASAKTDPVELPPLYDAIEPDALDAMVHRMSNGEVCFSYAGHKVTVRNDGTVNVMEKSVNQVSQATPVKND